MAYVNIVQKALINKMEQKYQGQMICVLGIFYVKL